MIHPTADVSPRAAIGDGTKIWHHAQIREGVQIGRDCIVGKGVYVDAGVSIGSNVKIQNGANIYHGVTIEDGVFVGPQVCFANDTLPRAVTPDGALKTDADWDVGRTLVRYGASLGAGAVVLPNLIVGRFAMVAAGAVVTRSVPDHALVVGVPARVVGFVCRCGRRLQESPDPHALECPVCKQTYELEAFNDSDLKAAAR